MKYRVYFYYDSEYQGYVADALDLPGCISQGKSFEEAKQNIKDAIRAYLEVEKEKCVENRAFLLPEETFIGEVSIG